MTSQELTTQAATLLLRYLAFVERQGSDTGFRMLAAQRLAQLHREAVKLQLIQENSGYLKLTDRGRLAIDTISMAVPPLPTLTPQDLQSHRA